MNTIRLKRRIVSALAVIVMGMPLAVSAQSSSEKEESSGETSDRGTHELGHVLQQKKSSRSEPGERVMRPTYGGGQDQDPDKSGRVKVRIPAIDGSDKGRRSDPDRPVITGRVPNPGSADGSVPTETLSLNFEKVRLSSVRVSERLRHKNRALFLGQDNRIYLVPDGIYGSKTKGKVEIARGVPRYSDITLKRGYTANNSSGASGDVVMKGSKIKENAASAAAPGSQSTPSQNKVIVMAAATEDGRYTGPGGAWIEMKGGEIVAIGGQLERHKPPPFYDVTGDGGLRIRDK
jgi:hypothetical protein